MKEKNVPHHLIKIGKEIKEGWCEISKAKGLKIKITGIDPLATFKFDYEEDSQAIITLFTQEMLKRGYLAGKSVYVSFSHKEKDVKNYLKDVEEVFGKIKYAIEKEKVYNLLEVPVAKSGFKRLT